MNAPDAFYAEHSSLNSPLDPLGDVATSLWGVSDILYFKLVCIIVYGSYGFVPVMLNDKSDIVSIRIKNYMSVQRRTTYIHVEKTFYKSQC